MANDAKILDNMGIGAKKPSDAPKNATQTSQIPPGIEKLVDKMIKEAVPGIIEVFGQKLSAQAADPNSELNKGINDKIANVYCNGVLENLVLAGVSDFLHTALPETK